MSTALIPLIKDGRTVERFAQILGENKAQKFASSLVQLATQNTALQKCEPVTVINAALTAAVLDLSIIPNLGYAYVVPYGKAAQFQIGWKGLVQLAQRTGLYRAISALPVYENQFNSWNPLTEELQANMATPGTGKVVGYVAYFELVNGFKKVNYMTYEEAKKHATKYSKAYNAGRSVWNDGEDGFNSMATKTVLKLTLSKWGPMSDQLQTAVIADQAVQHEAGEFEYLDNPKGIELGQIEEDKEKARVDQHIKNAKTTEELDMVLSVMDKYPDLQYAYNAKAVALKK